MLGSDEIVINDVGSDITYQHEIKLALFDYDDQVMVLNNVSQIIITPVDTTISSIGGVNSVLLKNGVATFNSLKAIAKYGSKNIEFQASSKVIDNSKIREVYGAPISRNIILFNFRNCKPGESKIDNYKCRECSAGSYSLQWSSPE